jgi:hypothetical protein
MIVDVVKRSMIDSKQYKNSALTGNSALVRGGTT